MRKLLYAATAALISACVQHADSKSELDFMSANYMAGIRDGVVVWGVLLGAQYQDAKPWLECIGDKTDDQFGAVMIEWLEENPEHLDEARYIAPTHALKQMCKGS